MNVAVLGLGIIGSAWAQNLHADGVGLRTWNRTAKADLPGHKPTVGEAVEGADFVFIVVADPPAVASILEQALPSLRAGQVVIQCSTISALWTKKFAAQVEATGAAFLEAPFTGSRPAAEQRKTVFYVGGEEATLEKCRPVLERLAASILHIGPTGSASSLKLAMNVNIAGVAQALMEALALCRAEGIEDETFFSALRLNMSRSGVADLKEPKLRERDYAPQFAVKHMAKDLRLAMETALGDGLALKQLAQLLAGYQQAMDSGWAEEDYTAVMRAVEGEQR